MKLATKRALMRRLWNEGDSSHADIAATTGLSVDIVAEWLAKQPGYPGVISPRMVTCAVCGVPFPCWRQAAHRYCSAICAGEARRRTWRHHKGKRRGTRSSCTSRKWRGLTLADQRIVEAARQEARERGVSRDAVLAEWKFEPERSTAP